MSKTIAVIPGDGIGPEIMTATLRVLDALDCGLTYDTVEAGMIEVPDRPGLGITVREDFLQQHAVKP